MSSVGKIIQNIGIFFVSLLTFFHSFLAPEMVTISRGI
jgi:hypothetical protein